MTDDRALLEVEALIRDLDRLEAELGHRLYQTAMVTGGRKGASGAAAWTLALIREKILAWCAEPETRTRFGCECVDTTAAAVESMTNREFARFLRVLLDAASEQSILIPDVA